MECWCDNRALSNVDIVCHCHCNCHSHKITDFVPHCDVHTQLLSHTKCDRKLDLDSLSDAVPNGQRLR